MDLTTDRLRHTLRPRARGKPLPRTAEASVVRSPTAAPSARDTYRSLGSKGLTPSEAGNLTAYLRGLRPVQGGWTIAEIDHLLFLRYLVAQGDIAS